METPPVTPMPKKSCIITLMFAVDTDEEALHVKKILNEVVKNIKDKRYSFQINET